MKDQLADGIIYTTHSIEASESQYMLMKSKLLKCILDYVTYTEISEVEMLRILPINMEQLTHIMNSNLSEFSLELLVEILFELGFDVKFSLDDFVIKFPSSTS